MKFWKEGGGGGVCSHERGCVNVIPVWMKNDTEYKYLFLYEDPNSKLVVLKAMRSDDVAETANKLLDVVATIGAPLLLESSVSGCFSRRLLREFKSKWANVPTTTRHEGDGPASGHGQRVGEICRSVDAWLAENPTKCWLEGIKIVQALENASLGRLVDDSSSAPLRDERLDGVEVEAETDSYLSHADVFLSDCNDDWLMAVDTECMLHALDAEAGVAASDPGVDGCEPLRAHEAMIDLDSMVMDESKEDARPDQNYFYEQEEQAPSVELASLEDLLSSMDRRLVELRNNEHFKCDLCEAKHEKLSELEAHARSHDRPDHYVCQVCFKSFHVLRIFNKHLRSAHPELRIEPAKDSASLKPVAERAKRPSKAQARRPKSADWECHLCKRKFVYQSILKRHVRSHTNERPFDCKLCEQRFFQRSHLSQHFVRCHTKCSSNWCAGCEASFDTRQDFLRHYREKHQSLEPLKHLLECDFCKKIFFDKSGLRRHIDVMHVQLQPRYSCEICDKKFKLECNLQNHMYTHTEVKMFGCSICGRKFSQKSVLQAHAKRHTDDKPFQCEVCGLRFFEKLKFVGHARRHTNERPFECSHCGKSFALKETLRRHENAVHFAKPTYQCEICAKMFKQLVHLNVHKRVHSDERPFQCTVCKASFKYRALLKNHEDIHKNVRRYECFDCRATFMRKSNLRMHISGMHTKERPFHCTHCDKKFKQKSHLNGHLRTHTKALPFSCDICGHRCNRRDNLNKHIKTHDLSRIVKRRSKKSTLQIDNLIKLYGQ